MEITHNEINGLISKMEHIVSKGQPFAKRNKNRAIRAVLKDMKSTQTSSPTIKEVWFYFFKWMRNIIK